MTNANSVLLLLDSVSPQFSVVNAEGANDNLSDAAPAHFELLLDLACSIAADYGGKVRVLSVLEAEADTSLSLSTLATQRRRQQVAAWVRATAKALAERLAGEESGEQPAIDPLPDIQPAISVVHVGEYWREVASVAKQQEATLLVSAWTVPDAAIDGAASLQHDMHCDVVMVRPAQSSSLQGVLNGESTAGESSSSLKGARVLVPARGGPHASLALRIAGALAARRSAEIALLHIIRQDLSERERVREERPFSAMLEKANLPITTRKIWSAGGAVTDVIMERVTEYDLLVLGAPAAHQGEVFSLGSVASTILEIAPTTILLVKTAAPAEPAIHALLQNDAIGGNLAPEALSLVVDKWFAENTFTAEEYADLQQLVELKRQRGLTISLGLPTLNEEATIGEIIATLKGALMDHVPLLDEIVVIDSRSTDRTREIARSLGVPVAIHQEVLPEAGEPLTGKGEALWKSLHVLKGDLIAWVDTDVINMHPRFVYGLLGPLLHEPRIAYVKGYYHRPIKIGDKLEHEGGGRVTELTVRPLFNLFFPMLSGFVQPLAGEYAGRREVLEKLPFFSGYGVETGLLIDLLEEYGLSAIGQVNLGERIHRNQSLANLSLMSFALVQVILSRLEQQARVHLIEDVNRSMKLIRFSPEQLSLDLRFVSDVERPPIHTIPAYRYVREPGRYAPAGVPPGGNNEQPASDDNSLDFQLAVL